MKPQPKNNKTTNKLFNLSRTPLLPSSPTREGNSLFYFYHLFINIYLKKINLNYLCYNFSFDCYNIIFRFQLNNISVKEHIQRWLCLKNSQWFEGQDELPMVWNYLAWTTCNYNDFPPSPAARDAHKALLGKNRQWCKKLSKTALKEKIPKKLGKS